MAVKNTKPTEPTTAARQPLFFVRPKNAGAVDALVDSIADGIADALIEEINASRFAKGLPPLEDDD